MHRANYQFEAIGTQWLIETDEPLSVTICQQITVAIEAFDAAYSRFRTDSLVCVARSQAPGNFVFPANIRELYPIYSLLHTVSNGKINPLVGGSLEQLGYDATYSFRAQKPLPAPRFGSVQLTENALHYHEKALLDIGAIGKGYLVDALASIVATHHRYYTIDGSGDAAVHTEEPEIIGLEHPLDAGKVIGTVTIARGSLCASAINRRVWGEGTHHIVDATTGKPLDTDVVASWAIAPTTMIADALATGLFFAEPDALFAAFGDFFYVIMRKDGSVIHNLTPEVGEIFA